MPKIAVINESTSISDAEILTMLPAFGEQWNKDLVSVWRVEPAEFGFIHKGAAPDQAAWWLAFFDTSDQADALAYHDLTNQGLPISKVFVKTIQQDKASLSVGATHELCEMAVDPWLNGAYQDSAGNFWAAEICDPVESDKYAYKSAGGVLVTDFITPNWYAHQHNQAQIDFKKHAHKPFEILSGGYAQRFDPNSGWVQLTGTKAAGLARATAAPGSRRERRARQARQNLYYSEVRKFTE